MYEWTNHSLITALKVFCNRIQKEVVFDWAFLNALLVLTVYEISWQWQMREWYQVSSSESCSEKNVSNLFLTNRDVPEHFIVFASADIKTKVELSFFLKRCLSSSHSLAGDKGIPAQIKQSPSCPSGWVPCNTSQWSCQSNRCVIGGSSCWAVSVETDRRRDRERVCKII